VGGGSSKEEFWEAARDEEMEISWKEANEGPPVTEDAELADTPTHHAGRRAILELVRKLLPLSLQ
jgi:hypothetical protein